MRPDNFRRLCLRATAYNTWATIGLHGSNVLMHDKRDCTVAEHTFLRLIKAVEVGLNDDAPSKLSKVRWVSGNARFS